MAAVVTLIRLRRAGLGSGWCGDDGLDLRRGPVPRAAFVDVDRGLLLRRRVGDGGAGAHALARVAERKLVASTFGGLPGLLGVETRLLRDASGQRRYRLVRLDQEDGQRVP